MKNVYKRIIGVVIIGVVIGNILSMNTELIYVSEEEDLPIHPLINIPVDPLESFIRT